MKTIWKYMIPSNRGEELDYELPLGAEPLALQMQDNYPTMWFLVDPEAKTFRATFVIVVTGGDVPKGISRYIGTFQAGKFVGHVFQTRFGVHP